MFLSFKHAVGGNNSAKIIGYPFVSSFQCRVRSDTPSSTCKLITPRTSKPLANIETGIQGVFNADSMQNSFHLRYIVWFLLVLLCVCFMLISFYVMVLFMSFHNISTSQQMDHVDKQQSKQNDK